LYKELKCIPAVVFDVYQPQYKKNNEFIQIRLMLKH